MIGPKTTMLLGEMSMEQLTALRNVYRHSRQPAAATLLRLLGTEIKIRRRVIREANMLVVLT